MDLAEQVRFMERRMGHIGVRSTLPGKLKEVDRLETGWTAIDAALGEFLDRLIERCGRRNVCRVTLVEAHVPEMSVPLHAWSEPKAKGQVTNRNSDPRIFATYLGRPSQLFEVPEPAQVISLVPDGPPSWIRWRARECAVGFVSGPERLALPWWEAGERTSSAADVVRDYYEVEDEQGRLLWMFREHATNGWFVHRLWA